MQTDLKTEYDRIGRERTAAGREHDRDGRRFHVWTLIWMWVWTIAGCILVAQSMHIQGQIGWIELPREMMRAKIYFWGGLFVGASGSFGTLTYRWKLAMDRGYFD